MAARGDYYGRTASGGLFDIFGKVLKLGGSILPGPIGTIARTIGGAISPAGKQNPIGATLPPPVPMGTGVSIGGSKGIQIGSFPASGLGTGTAWHPPMALPGKKHRRMNVTNPRALRRAIRRARGFEKMARKVLGFTSPRKPKGRSYFRARAAKR